ncbi:MAG TPA: glucokinase [Rhodanobacteraceae bacterium]|nr:glucokinase [Rhodanobacteraceae bacterium]
MNSLGSSSRLARPPFLAADIGGTHARVALVRAAHDREDGVELVAYREFECADFPSLATLLQIFVAEAANGASIRNGVLAVGGQVLGGSVINDNLAWPIRLWQVRQALAFDEVVALNDFEALGYARESDMKRGARLLWGADTGSKGAPTLVVGPGTGLGAAVCLPAVGGRVLTTEAGQMDFSPCSPRERAIAAHLAPDGGYVAYEQIVSGPGLLTLYTTLCGLDGVSPRLATPEAVTAAAMTATDIRASEAVQVFCAALGSFVGDIVLAHMAFGGVYLAGGFLSSMFGLLERSAFVERFLHGRSARTLLLPVPIRVVEHGRYGVLGAANWYLARVVAGANVEFPGDAGSDAAA